MMVEYSKKGLLQVKLLAKRCKDSGQHTRNTWTASLKVTSGSIPQAGAVSQDESLYCCEAVQEWQLLQLTRGCPTYMIAA
jgi:hypothetical protein